MNKDKKTIQLGMNPSTASGRLVKDLLWNFITTTGSNTCHHCGKPMTRDNFSIEHKVPWLDSESPVELYFDIENIGYSHLRCNTSAARNPISSPELHIRVPKHGTLNEYKYGKCRCDLCRFAKREEGQKRKQHYDPDARRRKYLEKGN